MFILTHKTCSKCGETKPVSEFTVDKTKPDGYYSSCKGCKNHYMSRVYYANAKDRIIAYTKTWTKQNPDKVKEYHRTNRKRHFDKHKAYNQKYSEEHPGFHTERSRVWRANHRDVIREQQNRRRAKERKLPSTFTIKDWNRVLELFNGVCAYCGQKEKLQQDHFIPVNSGGGYELGNIVPACGFCNSSKNDRLPEEWCSQETYNRITGTLASLRRELGM